MRIGNNPLRFKNAPSSYKDIVFVVVTHLPELESDYHKHRMDVITECIYSMRVNSHREHTLVIWDNGSCNQFREFLRVQNELDPFILIESPNIGKTAARTSAIQMLPLGSIVCYSDDDILYSDNWLNPQLDLLTSFPNVACVSGYPVRTMFRWGNLNTLEWARKNAKLEQGRFISKEDEMDYADSIGRSHDEQISMTLKDVDYKIRYNGKEAYATSHHCQFIGYAIKILPALTYDDMAMGDEKVIDIELDKLGLRLCTTKRYTRHIGNVLDEKIKNDISSPVSV